MKTALFGGTFDPIHQGHLRPVRRTGKVLQLDRIIYLPTACPPHKPEGTVAPAWARYVMVELAVLDDPSLLVRDWEMKPGEPSYTVDTAERFRREHPEDELFLLLGADGAQSLPSWHRWRDLIEAVQLVVMGRGQGERQNLHPRLLELRDRGRLTLLQNEPVPVSSTELRRRIGAGEEISGDLVPAPVLRYIQKYGLYR